MMRQKNCRGKNILLRGSVLGGGLGTACLLLLWWDEHRSTPLLMASEPPSPEDEEEAPSRPPLSIRLRHSLTFRRVLHTWRVVQPEPVDAPLVEAPGDLPCHRCGVPAPRASLLRCAHCHHLFHKMCCLWMAGHGVEEALCQPCWNEQEARRRRCACQAALWPPVDDQGEQGKGGR